MIEETRDVFICHTHLDNPKVVTPLCSALKKAGITIWRDIDEIQWGENLLAKVNEGLRKSRFVIVVLSPSFLDKSWPQFELNSTLNKEAATGEVRVLPLMVGNGKEIKLIFEKFPLLEGKLYIPWDGKPKKIVDSLIKLLKKATPPPIKKKITKKISKKPNIGNTLIKIPLPKIKKEFSDLEKDAFLKKSFSYIKAYFKNALKQLEKSHSGIKTQFSSKNSSEFICKVYLQGKIKNGCKILIGGFYSRETISFSQGTNVDSPYDNSINDYLLIEDNGFELLFKVSGMNFYSSDRKDYLSISEAPEYFWNRFKSSLEH